MIIDSKQWKLINQEARMNKGKLINVEISKGRYVKMYEADAIAQGKIKPPAAAEKKLRIPPANKMWKPEANKVSSPVVGDPGAVDPQAIMVEIVKLENETPPPEELATSQDDLTTIPGVGKASARALAAHGVETLEALKAAQDLDYLPAKVLAAIAKWRSERG